jgi:7-keto-8-aminopelargonate synthetase-like enzyme
MTGEVLDIKTIMATFDLENNYIIIDESHSLGVMGKTGKGLLEGVDFDSNNIIRTGTFSKAFGVYGGFVFGNKIITKKLKDSANVFRASTPLPVVLCKAILNSLDLFEKQGKINKLKKNIDYMNNVLSDIGFRRTSKVPIYILKDDPNILKEMSEEFKKNKMIVPYMDNYP